jgi:hypothetical protein
VPLHVTTGRHWDDRRNTSQVRRPAPDALGRALGACDALRQAEPDLVAWIEAGAPTLSEAEHLERFGVAHPGRSTRGR